MYIIDVKNNKKCAVKVKQIEEQDYKTLTKSRYYFNWKTEKENDVYKLVLDENILGLMSLVNDKGDKRIEISLLAVSKENRGKNKRFDRITGILIAFACRTAIKYYGIEACVSLVPKTRLKQYYIDQYQMTDAGWQVFLTGQSMLNILKKYEL
ncbi:MAG: N-acetyltransferase [Flavobacteriia bacterium]|nr:N-acetyltransferase [Flavobacteriia bacterium]